jgi:hypothetical protein
LANRASETSLVRVAHYKCTNNIPSRKLAIIRGSNIQLSRATRQDSLDSNDALQQGLHHDVNNVRRRCHLAIRCVESIQTLEEAYSEDRQQLEAHLNTDSEETVWVCTYSKKYTRLAKHLSNADLHGPNGLEAIKHGEKFYKIPVLCGSARRGDNRRTHPRVDFMITCTSNKSSTHHMKGETKLKT